MTTMIIEHAGQPGRWPQFTMPDRLFAGETNDCGGPQPNNTADQDDWPELIPGFWPRKLEGQRGWKQEEDHRGEKGYLHGQSHTINQIGPYPDGWSTEPPEPTAEEKAVTIRGTRDALIAATDYLLMPDYPLTPEARAELEQYRQELRDVTKQGGFPDKVIWPNKPAWLAS